MKLPQFNINVCLDDGNSVTYNTFSRKYLSPVDNANYNLTKDKCCYHLETGLVVDNDCDETLDLVQTIQNELENGEQTLTILPTTKCNARCWYCYEKGIQHYDMSQDIINYTIKFIEDKFQIEHELSINWFGGEPLMHFDAIRQISMAAKSFGYTLNTCITTNGLLITPEFINLLKENYKDISMSITIDAIGDEYGKIKRFVKIPPEHAYNKVISNIKSLLSVGIRVLLRINFTAFEEAKKIYSHLETLLSDYPKTLYYIYYAPIWRKDRGHSLEESLEYLDYMKNGYDINVLANPYIDNVFVHHIANERNISYCTAMNKHHYVINADGLLYRCHCLVSDKKYSCGDVKNGVNNSSLGYQMFEPNIKNEQCKLCPILPICLVKCKASNILYGEDIVCANTKTIIEPVIKFKVHQKEKRRCR